MAELKTKPTESSVEDFINDINEESVRNDSIKIAELMEKATAEKPKMWGVSIIGFGKRHLKYESGRELDWMKIGFSPGKANLTLYLTLGGSWNEDLLSQLGRHKIGKGCLYIKRLSDVDENILQKLIESSVQK